MVPHQRLTILCCASVMLWGGEFSLNADTLSQGLWQETGSPESDSLQPAAAPAATAQVEIPDSAVKPQAQKANRNVKSRRDSTLRNLLATLAKEDSLNALLHQDTAASVGEKQAGKRRASGGIGKFLRNLLPAAGHSPWLFFAIVCAGICAILRFVVSRIFSKKQEKRFMTTTRLSLMDSEVRRACLHIEKHFTNPTLTPAGVCAAIITGEPFLEALFERELGMSIAAYIDQVRIHHVKQLVRENPAADALTAASQAGFSKETDFEELFRKLAGTEFETFRKEKQAMLQS